jgi:cell division protein FtsL
LNNLLVAPKYNDYTYEPTIAMPKRNRQGKKRLPARAKYSMVLFVVLAFVTGLALTSRVALYFYKGYEIAELNREIEALQTGNARLKLEIEQLCSLNRVEDLAINKLGMVKPSAEDIELLPVEKNLALASNNGITNDGNDSFNLPPQSEEQAGDSLLAVWSDKLSSLFVQIVEASEL